MSHAPRASSLSLVHTYLGTLITAQPRAASRRCRASMAPPGVSVFAAKWYDPSASSAMRSPAQPTNGVKLIALVCLDVLRCTLRMRNQGACTPNPIRVVMLHASMQAASAGAPHQAAQGRQRTCRPRSAPRAGAPRRAGAAPARRPSESWKV